jgi:transcriptional regulator with XRE-family HTH domain
MSHFSTALTDIVERSFNGKWAELSRASGLDASIISRLAAGKFEPTIDRLAEIAKSLSRGDRKQLLIAAARDRVPADFQDEIFGDEDAASQLLRAKLSPDLAAVIRFLEGNAMTDEATGAYLRKIGEWVGITQPNYGQLKVADNPRSFKVEPK